MKWFHATSLLDRTFEIGIIVKGLDGLLEAIGGILLFFISPEMINRWATTLTEHELSDNSHDFVATHILDTAHGLTAHGSLVFAALYLLSHGVVKIVLVAAILKERLWAYPWMIAFLMVFIVYQIYRITFAPSIGLIVLTLFDLFIVWLTWLEYQKRQKHQATS